MPNDKDNAEKGVAVANPMSALERATRIMDLEAGVPGESNNAADIVKTIQEEILAASDEEAIFAAADAGLAKAEDLVDVPLVLHSISWNRSGFTDTPGVQFYAVVSAFNVSTQEEITFGIGSQSAMMQLFRLAELGKLDGLKTAIKSKPTAAGFTVLFFRPLTPGESKLVAA